MTKTIPIKPHTLLSLGLLGAGVLWENLFGPSGVGWGLIGVGLLLVLWVEGNESRRLWPRRVPLEWPLLLLLLLALLSLAVTADPDLTAVQVTRLGAALAGFCGPVQWARRRQQLRLTAMALILAGVALALVAPVVVDWNQTKGIPIPAAVYAAFPLLVSNAVHPNIMAALMALLFPLPLAYLLPLPPGSGWPSRLRWGGLLLACGLMGLVLVLTKSRGGYLAGAAGALAVLWLGRRRVLASVLTLLVLGIGLWLLTSVNQQAPEVVEGVADPGTWAFRQEVWRIAIWMLRDFPFTGVGMGAFNNVATRLYPFPDVSNPSAHNLFLQVGVDLGLLGLIAFLAVVLLTLSMGWMTVRALAQGGDRELWPAAVGAWAGFVALLAHGLVDVTVWGTRAGFVPWLVIGLIVALHMHVCSVRGQAARR